MRTERQTATVAVTSFIVFLLVFIPSGGATPDPIPDDLPVLEEASCQQLVVSGAEWTTNTYLGTATAGSFGINDCTYIGTGLYSSGSGPYTYQVYGVADCLPNAVCQGEE